MKVFPAVDILGGSCVQLVQGKRDSATIYGDPLTCVNTWLSQGATALHIVNLDGAFGSATANAEKIRTVITETGVEIQLGGGIRSIEDARSWLDTGVDRVILGTYAVNNPDCLTILSEEFGSDRIMAGADAKNGQIVVDGWERSVGGYIEWADLFIRKGAGSLLYTNVNVEGLCKGVETAPVKELINHVDKPVIVAGGISHPDDVREMRSARAAGVILGSALYNGTITLNQAIEAAR